MRPVVKGVCPQVKGIDRVVRSYKDWRADLISRIGSYCAYCNMPLSHQLQVEHVVPKQPRPGQLAGSLLEWDNMLLACGPCNQAKSNRPSSPDLHYLPEVHNGLLAFHATAGSSADSLIVSPRPGLSAVQHMKAGRTIQDLGLAQEDQRNTVVDIRPYKRWQAGKSVEAARALLDTAKHAPSYDAAAAGRLIASIAQAVGFFILWFDAFADEPEVLRYLADPAYSPGIDAACFDPVTFRPIPRNPSSLADPI